MSEDFGDTAAYLTDRTYPPVFHPEQSPGWLGSVLNALGQRAPEGGNWCEIGCGEGFMATLLAAANPGMQFTGIDLNPDHIARATARAKAAGLTNLTFVCADIAGPDAPTGRFDVIVCHGLLSWVSPRVRRALADWVGASLAPGGVAAIQYMSAPGGLAFQAFHTVFQSVRSHPDPVAEGLRRLLALRDAKAGYFQLHGHASQTLDNLLGETPGYIAHEYLNPDFHPMPFADVAALFAGQGFSWAGSATPMDNIDTASLPTATGPLIGPVKDIVERETLKDLARNQAFRYDMFRRSAQNVSEDEHLDLLRAGRWCVLPGAPKPGALTFASPIGPVEGDAALYGPLLTRLGQGPASFAELEGIAPFTGRPGLLNQVLQMGLWARIVHPVVAAPDPSAARRLNAVLLDEARKGASVPALAAPALGAGLVMTKSRVKSLLAGQGSADLRHLLCLDT